MSKNLEFLKAVDSMTKSMGKVMEAYWALDFADFEKADEGYPFVKEFSELLSDVMQWRDMLHEKLAD